MQSIVRVGMAELAAIQAPGLLSTLGLGSCVAVCLYDRQTKVAGLSHVMLADCENPVIRGNPGKFADTAIPLIISEMVSLGAAPERMRAILAGGAEMFSFSSRALPRLRIGERNIEAVQKALHERNIPIVHQSVGGRQGKSVHFDADTGIVKVRTLMGEDEEFRFC